MALSQKHRVALYEHFVPELGEEATEALLSEFPGREGDEPVSRTHLRAEMADLRTELRTEMADLRTELRTEMADLRTELRTEMADLRTEVQRQANKTIVVMVAAMGVWTGVISAVT